MGGPGSGRYPKTQAPCGTKAKYNYHLRRKETCQMCKDANAAWNRARNGSKPRTLKPPRSARKQNRKDWLVDQKISRVACMDCGLKVTQNNTYVFDYDHRDPHIKLFSISSHCHDYTEYVLLQEMDKCDLVCANCHRHRTRHQQKTGILTGYRKDRSQQQTLICHDSVLTLFDLSNI